MAELIPIPFEHLLRRALTELERQGSIFDLPQRKFYRGLKGVDTSVRFCGHAAATPLGPAAGPHTQLAQNIVLAWLGGGRIMELKTVQILDRLKISRPCIDIRNIGFNVEWSQELRLEESLREYVAAHMLIEILEHAEVLGPDAGETIFDISVGYDLKGITSSKVRGWLASIRDASKLVEYLRDQIPAEFAEYRKLPFQTQISDSITLSTFHGCPADEIEGIVAFLIAELDFHVTIKMNPPMLGKALLEEILHDRLGYRHIKVNPKAYDTGITFDEGVDIVRRLQPIAERHGKHLGVKFSNTLEVINEDTFFQDEVMYLSGAPLHVLAMTLVEEWRNVFGAEVPISFSAGIDQHNFPDAVACGLVPITTCTDLLRPGGYGRLHKYLHNLGARMQECGAATVDAFILKAYDRGAQAATHVLEQAVARLRQTKPLPGDSVWPAVERFLKRTEADWRVALESEKGPSEGDYASSLEGFLSEIGETEGDRVVAVLEQELADLFHRWVGSAAVLNTHLVREKVLQDPRYRYERNRSVPRKIGSHLLVFDCINCDKCIPVCPNDANFSYEIEPLEHPYDLVRLTESGAETVPGGIFRIEKSHQIANFADLCNDCGNCDVFCPEDGGPFVEKPRFFANAESWHKHRHLDGFLVERRNDLVYALARIGGTPYSLVLDPMAGRARFSDEVIEVEVDSQTHELLQTWILRPERVGHVLDMRYYLTTVNIVRGVLAGDSVNYVNVALAS
jgi:putative selenate reductase